MGKPKKVTREDLIAAAKQLLAQSGQAKITLKNVAETAGVTQGVVYYHFKTKDQLLLALLQEVADHTLAEIRQILRKKQDTRQGAALHALVREQLYKVQTGADDHPLFVELSALSLHHREMRLRLGQAQHARVQLLAQLADGDGRKGRILAAVLDGLAIQALFDPSFNGQEIYGYLLEWLTSDP